MSSVAFAGRVVLSALLVGAVAIAYLRTIAVVARAGLGSGRTLAACTVLTINVGVLAALSWVSWLDHPIRSVATLVAANVVAWKVAERLVADRTVVSPARRRPSAGLVVGLVGLGAVAALIVAQVILYSPTGYDSMAYHLPKLAHLIDTGSVAPFASHRTTVIETPWGYTYLAYEWWLVTGDRGLRYLGIVQFAGFLACAGLISQVILDLRTRRGATTRATAVLVTLATVMCSPMLLMQSASTRNDLVAAAFCLLLMRGAVYIAVRPLDAANVATGALLCAFGGAGVLAVKSNLLIQGVVFVALLFLWTGIRTWRDRRAARVQGPRRSVHRPVVALLAAVAVVLSLPFVQTSISNLTVFDSLTGPAGATVLGERPSASDAVCRTSMSLAWESRVDPATPNVVADLLAPVSEFEQRTLRSIADVCGDRLFAEANNLTPTSDPFEPGGVDGNEDWQSSPLQLHLFVGAVLGLLVVGGWASLRRRRRRRRVSDAVRVLACGVVALSFAAAFSPWQYFSNSRFLLPTWLLVDAVALLIVFGILQTLWSRVSDRLPRAGRLVAVGIGVLLVTAQTGSILGHNVHRPLPGAPAWGDAPRGDGWATSMRASLGEPPVEPVEGLIAAAQAIGCHTIGVSGDFVFRYPLWLALRQAGIRVMDTDVQNASRTFGPDPEHVGVCLHFGPDTVRSRVLAQDTHATVADGWIVWLPQNSG